MGIGRKDFTGMERGNQMKIVIWGLGNMMNFYMARKGLYKDKIIVAFVDNNPLLWGKRFHDVPIVAPAELHNLEYEYIIICVFDDINIKKQLIIELGVDEHKIKSIREIDEYYTKKVIDKYKESNDLEIRDTVSYYTQNGLSLFARYSPDRTDYEVFRDGENHPYIVFDKKRIYYPDKYSFFIMRNGKEYVTDIMYEQKENSPHLYVKDENIISKGSVVVDAGTCEGNFAIRFIDKVSKMYLIESDPIWIECLKRTFLPYKDKVVICNKQLARYDSSSTITLDSLLMNQKIDFLKMDIEGAEIDALLGAQDTLLKSNANCAICSYHKMNDEKNIKFILNNLGYQTQTSDGYIFFGTMKIYMILWIYEKVLYMQEKLIKF